MNVYKKGNARRVTQIVFLGLFYIFLLLIVNQNAFAAGGEAGVPWGAVSFQAINVALTIALIYWAAAKTVREHFKSKHEEYHQELKKAEVAKEKAETEHRKIKERLSQLQSNAEESLSKAKAESEELKHKLIKDAQSLSEKLLQESERSAKYEFEKAKQKYACS